VKAPRGPAPPFLAASQDEEQSDAECPADPPRGKCIVDPLMIFALRKRILYLTMSSCRLTKPRSRPIFFRRGTCRRGAPVPFLRLRSWNCGQSPAVYPTFSRLSKHFEHSLNPLSKRFGVQFPPLIRAPILAGALLFPTVCWSVTPCARFLNTVPPWKRLVLYGRLFPP